jgi:hypothetical protein
MIADSDQYLFELIIPFLQAHGDCKGVEQMEFFLSCGEKDFIADYHDGLCKISEENSAWVYSPGCGIIECLIGKSAVFGPKTMAIRFSLEIGISFSARVDGCMQKYAGHPNGLCVRPRKLKSEALFQGHQRSSIFSTTTSAAWVAIFRIRMGFRIFRFYHGKR